VCTARIAESFVSKGVGLLGRRSLSEDRGLLIKPCTSIHTFFMFFTIDVVFLDSNEKVVKCLTMRPFRFALGGSGAKQVLELAAGSVSRLGLAAGDVLRFNPIETDKS